MSLRRSVFVILITSCVAAAILFTVSSGEARAAAMPMGHDIFSNNPRICIVCHRTHTATAENLLRTGAGMCLTCHSGGIAADTDVAAGRYVAAPEDFNSWGVVGEPLLGGGFSYIDGVPTAYGTDPIMPGTSQHQVGGDPVVPFGSASGATINMSCTSCHKIHAGIQGTQYRLLRLSVGDTPGPLVVPWNGPWEGPAQTAPNTPNGYRAYTETNFSVAVDINDPRVVMPDLVDPDTGWTAVEYTRNYKSGLSAWCDGCHNVYGTFNDSTGQKIRHTVEVPLMLSAIPGTKLSAGNGDPSSDLPLNDLTGNGRTDDDTLSCMTCHRAHGTTVSMDKMGVYNTAARGSLPPMTGSMLLRKDNRGVCVNCHHNFTSTF